MSGSTTLNLDPALESLRVLAQDRVRKAIALINADAIAAAEQTTKMRNQHQIQTERIQAWELEEGDIIVEFQSGKRPSQTTVTAIEHSACASRGTHVNKNWCYDARALVWVRV